MQCVRWCVYVCVCLLSSSSIRVSLVLRKWLINIYTKVEMHFEVPTHCKKKRRLQHKLQGDRERLNKADGWKQTSSCSSPPTRSQTIAISTPLCSGLPSASQRGVWSERGGNCCEFVGNWKLLYPPVSPSLPALKTSTPLLPLWRPPSIPIHS